MNKTVIVGAVLMGAVFYTVYFMKADRYDPSLVFVGIPHSGKKITLQEAHEADTDVARDYYQGRLVGQSFSDVEALCLREKGFSQAGLHHVQSLDCLTPALGLFEIRYRLPIKDQATDAVQSWEVEVRVDPDTRKVTEITRIATRIDGL